jgi:KaiC/GvpD/RAD55 family RecA-like ATPase
MLSDGFISTGIEKLDNLLEGGTPKGYTVLILGSPGSGIEILSKQLASSGKVLYFSTDETEQEFIKTMDRFNWLNRDNIEIIDFAKQYSDIVINDENKRINVYEQRSKNNLKELIQIGSSGIVESPKETEDFLADLSNRIRNNKNEKIILNSLDFFLDIYSEEEVIRTIHAAKIINIQNNGILFLIMTQGIHGELFERKMEGIADCVIELEVIQKGSTFERFLSIKKMKNYAKKIGIARYAIDSEGFVLEMIERIM